jgi:hypothetical protein
MSPALKFAVVVLAIIGGLAVLGLAGMALMHFLMMGSFGAVDASTGDLR